MSLGALDGQAHGLGVVADAQQIARECAVRGREDDAGGMNPLTPGAGRGPIAKAGGGREVADPSAEPVT